MDRDDQLTALAELSEWAASTATDLTAAVEHCPEWTVSDLLVHLADVQSFWSDVIERGVTSGDDIRRPGGLPDGAEPVAHLRAQTERLLGALGGTGDETPMWTWFEPEQNAGFVVRRQVLEAAVHAWDVANATGQAEDLPLDVSELGLIEFCEVMAQNVAPGKTPPVALSLEPTDTEWRGTIFGETDPIVALAGSASDLFLLLWGRNESGDDRIDEAIAAINLD